MTRAREVHWDNVYRNKADRELSWYEPRPRESLALLRRIEMRPDDPIIDVGAGASLLVDDLLDAGFRDVSVLDVSGEALGRLRRRLEPRGSAVNYLQCEVTAFRPERRYALWHDRAAFHFLVRPEERAMYAAALRGALLSSGHALIATFGPSGPRHCSGLPTAHYDPATLAREFSGELQLLESRLVMHRTPWDAEQQFLYCLFRSTAVVATRDTLISGWCVD